MIAVVGAEETWVNGRIFPTPAGMAVDWHAQRLLLDSFPGVSTFITPAPWRDAWDGLSDWTWPTNTDWQHSGWVSLYKGHGNFRRWVHIGLLEKLRSDPVIGPLGNDPMMIGPALKRWHSLTGAEYRTSPAVSAVASIREITKRHKRAPTWILQNRATADWWQPPGQIHDLNYEMTIVSGLTPQFQYDRRGAYLASAAAVQLPYRELRPTGYDYDPRCGYYNVLITQDNWMDLSPLLGTPDRNGAVWVCQDTLAVLREFGFNADVIDSWSTDQSGRILRPWAEKWRDALSEMEGTRIQPALKAGYAQALGGLLGVPRGTVYRPDIRHMIMDNNRAHLLRIALSVYRHNSTWPAKMHVDSLYYYQRQLTIPTGDRIGNMREILP